MSILFCFYWVSSLLMKMIDNNKGAASNLFLHTMPAYPLTPRAAGNRPLAMRNQGKRHRYASSPPPSFPSLPSSVPPAILSFPSPAWTGQGRPVARPRRARPLPRAPPPPLPQGSATPPTLPQCLQAAASPPPSIHSAMVAARSRLPPLSIGMPFDPFPASEAPSRRRSRACM